ncbi:hypothetical protein [Paramuribaculum intestinale]|uniref:hypothetical protein n=1 Tax=Paramuribaculum intestinale TaxID=2094151 RepID=UPI0032B1EA8C
MNTEDYVSYPLALALKKARFDEPCDHYWYKAYANSDEMSMRQASADDFNSDDWDVPHCSAPTLAQAQKWLREKKKIDVLVWNCACGYGWEVSKAENGTGLILFDDKGDNKDSGCWTSYESALSAGIAEALELIEKEGE